jgi:predicted SAM-dependent methyltransferase
MTELVTTSETDAHESELTLVGFARFELKAWLGRTFLSRQPPNLGEPRLLHLGAGTHLLDGWVNADFFRFRFWRAPASIWMIDLRQPLPCPDNYWDGAFSEHTLEHLSPSQAQRLMREVFRALRPGAWFRVTVPDVSRYVAYYQGKPSAEPFKQWPVPADALRSVTQGFGHRSVWDSQRMIHALRQAGFSPTRETAFREGTDSRLLHDHPERRWETCYVEAQKPPAPHAGLRDG